MIVTIQKDTFTRYKSPQKIPPGDYIFKRGLTKRQKEIYPAIPAQSDKIKFCWLIPADDYAVRELEGDEYEYNLDCPMYTPLIPTFLRPWQQKFLKKVSEALEQKKQFRKALIAGLGTGKTLIFLLICNTVKSTESLYVAPRHLHSTVRDEAKKWELPCPLITTPESLHKYEYAKILIIDEALSCKNPKTKRTQKVLDYADHAQIVIAGTGTPISAKRAPDFRWSRICKKNFPNTEKPWCYRYGINPHFLDLSKFGVEHTFIDWNGVVREKNPLVVDAWDTEKIVNDAGDLLHVVSEKDLGYELPLVTFEKVFVPGPAYFKAIRKGLFTQKTSHKAVMQARTSTSGFIYDDNKKPQKLPNPAKLEWLKNFIENNPEEPLVIFSAWEFEQKILKESIEKWTGSVPAMNTSTENTTNLFTHTDLLPSRTTVNSNYLICSAWLSEGLNLQRSRIGVFMSNSTSPDKRKQAQGRLHRQGQKRGVIFYDLVCRKTLDLGLLELLQKHQNESQEMVESMLMKMLRGEKQ